ncbi:MAG: arginine--tRNA ligase [Patescibacteria group bacterium]
MKSIIDTLYSAIDVVLTDMDVTDIKYSIEYPEELLYGDYSTNVAMVAAKAVVMNPKELARKIVERLGFINSISKIEIAGSGFINFHLSREYFAETVKKIDDNWGRGSILSGKKILIEKSAPNLFKPFHVGHLLNISIGESLARILYFSGADVIPVAYPSDISLGVAKTIWAILKKHTQGKLTINILGECYIYGTRMYDEDENIKQEIIEINKKLNTKESGVVWDTYKEGRELNLQYFKKITARLKSEFADYFFESDSGVVGKKIVQANIGKVFEESNGAIIFKGEKYGLHTRVFVTSLGLPVYEAKDIGLLKLKFEKYNPDVSVVITDVEQKQYFEVIKKAAMLIHEEWGTRSIYWQHGRLRFKGEKISSRYGNVPLVEDLLEQVKGVVREKMNVVKRKVQISNNDILIEKIALAALRYSFLQGGSGKNIIFDFKQSVSLEGNSGIYLQYSYVRAQSVLEKVSDDSITIHDTMLIPKEIPVFERLLPRFPATVERASKEYEPHYVTTYLTELASTFNSWYANERIIGSEYESYKRALTKAFATTMKNGLWLLGIDAPERM